MIAIDTPPPSQQCIRRLMRQMGSKNQSERDEALLELRACSPSALGPLLQFADDEYNQWGRRAFALMCMQGLPYILVSHLFPNLPFVLRTLLSVAIGLPCLFLLSKLLLRSVRLSEVIGALAEYEDVRVVRYLLQAQYLPDKSIRQASKRALLQLLPRMKAGDFIGFDERQHVWMRQLLLKNDPELAIACLRGLAWTPDERALKQVRKLLAGKAKTAQNAEVQEAAQECLHALEARMKGMTSDAILLRGASPPQKADVLLRPANAAEPTEPQQLLRASHDTTANS